LRALVETWRVEAMTSEADATKFFDWRDKLAMSARAACYRAVADELAALLTAAPEEKAP
jgi:hypothetical protein